MSRSAEPDLAALESDPRVRWTTDVLRFGDTDANGHINNSAFAVFCESGRVAILHSVLAAVQKAGGFFAIARLTVDFRAEMHFPGTVRAGTWVSALGRTSVSFGQVLVGPDGRIAATSEAVTVAMDGPTRRPMPLPPELRAAIEGMVRAG